MNTRKKGVSTPAAVLLAALFGCSDAIAPTADRVAEPPLLRPAGTATANDVANSQTWTCDGQIHTFTLPAGIKTVTISAVGAMGGLAMGGTRGGYGAIISAEYPAAETGISQLSILAGCRGLGASDDASAYRYKGGGGGGSFVWTSIGSASFVPLVAAGGGGGAASNDNPVFGFATNGVDASLDPSGTDGLGILPGSGGTNGNGGNGAHGAGGAGLLGNGGNSTRLFDPATGGTAIQNGGAGGAIGGGFGGGGGVFKDTQTESTPGGGGGGGCSGGGGGGTSSGGGGGSCVSGGTTSISKAIATDMSQYGNFMGDGKVTISWTFHGSVLASSGNQQALVYSESGVEFAPLTALVATPEGAPVAGVPVTFTCSAPSGVSCLLNGAGSSITVTTDGSGHATVGSSGVGIRSTGGIGTLTVTATATGYVPATFTATIHPTLTKVSGDDQAIDYTTAPQSGPGAGLVQFEPVVVAATPGVAGVAVTFTCSGCSVGGQPSITVVTDVHGRASPFTLTALAQPHTFTVTANTNGFSPVTFNGAVVRPADVTAPTTTAAPSGTAGANGWFKGNVSVSLTGTDNSGGSGVDGTFYTLDGGAQQTYAGPIVVTGNGTHTVTYWSVDEAGNVEAAKALTVKIDTAMPATSATPVGMGGGGFFRSVEVGLACLDGHSGCGSTLYRLDGGAQQAYVGQFPVTGNGPHTIEYWSVDNAGNAETPKTVTVKVDVMAPVTTAMPAGLGGGGDYFRGSVSVGLACLDGHSGCGSTLYRLDGGAQQTYPEAFVVTGDGTHTIAYWSVDKAGNIEEARTLTVKIDAGAPVVSCGSADGAWHASNVSIACTASDVGSGLSNAADASFSLSTNVPAGSEVANASTDFRNIFDNAGWSTPAGPIAGNKIDRKAPSVVCGAAPAGWQGDNVRITCTASDGGSGLANPADASFVLSTSVAPGTVDGNASTGSRVVCDAVGNCTTAGPISGIQVDRTAEFAVGELIEEVTAVNAKLQKKLDHRLERVQKELSGDRLRECRELDKFIADVQKANKGERRISNADAAKLIALATDAKVKAGCP